MDFAVCGMRPHKDVKPVIKMLTPNVLMKEKKIYVHSAKKCFVFRSRTFKLITMSSSFSAQFVHHQV